MSCLAMTALALLDVDDCLQSYQEVTGTILLCWCIAFCNFSILYKLFESLWFL